MKNLLFSDGFYINDNVAWKCLKAHREKSDNSDSKFIQISKYFSDFEQKKYVWTTASSAGQNQG